MSLFLSIGECLVELYAATDELWHLGISGDRLNTALYARTTLPPDREVGYVTRLGKDSLSNKAAAFITSQNIGLPVLSRHPSRNIGLYAISLTRGERSFTYWRDTSAARTLLETRDAVEAAVAKADAIHVSGISLAILPPEGRVWLTDIMQTAMARGAVCALDPNFRARLWSDAETARQATTAGAEATAQRFTMLGAGLVVVKNGRGLLSIAESGRTFEGIILPSVNPIDSTGAKGGFNGSFPATVLTDKSVMEAVGSAHAVARQVVQRRGGRVSITR